MIRNYFQVMHIIVEKIIKGNTQLVQDVPGTSPEGPLKVLISGTYKGPSGDSQGANTKLDGFEKNCFSEVIVLVLHVCFIFYRKSKYSKVLNGDVHRTSTGPSCVTSMEPNDGRPWDVGQSCFFKLNSQTR